MKPGDHLIDIERGETSVRVDELLAAGGRYQIAAATDTEADRPVVIRAILYDDEETSEGIEIRRRALRREWAFLQAMGADTLTPEPIDWIEVEDSPVDEPPEPLVIYERIDGPSLYEWIEEHHPRGVEPKKVLEFAAQLNQFLVEVHLNKWLWRDFDPRRFAIDESGQLRARSVGRIVKMGERLDPFQTEINEAYVGPEIRDEMTGQMQRPAADFYGLGALLSFLLTGEEPRERTESPLAFTAFERLQEWEEPGMELLVARLLQPLAKKRVARGERLQKYLTIETLPTRESKGFEMTMLPAPWLGLEMENPGENRGLRSKLSAGPLVSVARDAPVEAPVEKEAAESEARWTLNWPLIIGLAIFVGAAMLISQLTAG